jgi:uncharacterized membrane protein
VDLSVDERFAARITEYVTPLVSALSDDLAARFDGQHATLSLSGESEYSGNAFNRGLLVGLVYLFDILLAVATFSVVAGGTKAAIEIGPWVGLAALVPFLFTAAAMLVLVVGAAGLLFKTNVVDHTTEPAPDELDALREQYVDGEIDEQELGERAGEVWER